MSVVSSLFWISDIQTRVSAGWDEEESIFRAEMREAGIMLISTALTCVVIGNAYYQRKQFYPTVVHITKSNPSMTVSFFFVTFRWATRAYCRYICIVLYCSGDLRARIHTRVHDKRLPAKDLFRYPTRCRARSESIKSLLIFLICRFYTQHYLFLLAAPGGESMVCSDRNLLGIYGVQRWFQP